MNDEIRVKKLLEGKRRGGIKGKTQIKIDGWLDDAELDFKVSGFKTM
jgi:hypothetical protein